MNRKSTRMLLAGALSALAILVVTVKPATASPQPSPQQCQKPSVAILDDAATESDYLESSGLFFPVKLSFAHCTDVTVSYSTLDGTATAVTRPNPYGDYYGAQGAVTILAGQTTALIHVKINDDIVCESDETLYVAVSSVVGANLSDGSAKGTIINQWYDPECSDAWGG